MKYYLYAEPMMDDDGIPIAEYIKVYEKENILQAAQDCIEEIPSWMRPKIEECLDDENCACISFSLGGKETLLEICELDYLKVKDL